MDAYSFILKCIKPHILDGIFTSLSSCDLCGRSEVYVTTTDGKTDICQVCHFLQTPNPHCFGMLTKVRAHSAVSFLNSLIVFDEQDGLTMVVSEKYASQAPSNESIKFVVYGINNYIIKLLNNPSKKVIIKPSIRYEDFACDLMLSDERSVYIITPKGGYCINVDIWNRLSNLVRSNEQDIVSTAIEYLEKIAVGDLLNTDQQVREFVSKHPVLMIKFNELLSMDIHSRLYILKLLKLVCNEAI